MAIRLSCAAALIGACAVDYWLFTTPDGPLGAVIGRGDVARPADQAWRVIPPHVVATIGALIPGPGAIAVVLRMVTRMWCGIAAILAFLFALFALMDLAAGRIAFGEPSPIPAAVALALFATYIGVMIGLPSRTADVDYVSRRLSGRGTDELGQP